MFYSSKWNFVSSFSVKQFIHNPFTAILNSSNEGELHVSRSISFHNVKVKRKSLEYVTSYFLLFLNWHIIIHV